MSEKISLDSSEFKGNYICKQGHRVKFRKLLCLIYKYKDMYV